MNTRWIWVLLAASLAFGCGDDDGGDAGEDTGGDVAPDVAEDTAPPPECNEDFTFESGSEDGAADPLSVPAGEARVGRLEQAELPADPVGIQTYKAGDFALVNEHLAFIVEDMGDSDLYDPWGGKLVGIAKNDGGTLVEPADYNEVIVGIGRFTVNPTSITVMNDGTDGQAAVLRVIGQLAFIPFIEELAKTLITGEFGDLEVAVEYRLEPGARYVDVYYTFNGERATPTFVAQPLIVFFQDSRMPRYAPTGAGFGESEGTLPYIAFAEDGATSYAFEMMGGGMNPLIDVSGASAVIGPTFSIPACAQTERHHARIHAAGPGIDPLLASIAAVNEQETRTITGSITGTDSAEGLRVHAVMADGGYITRDEVNPDLTYSLTVPADAAVKLTVFRRGNIALEQDVPASETTANFELAAVGTISVNVEDTAVPGVGMPARVQVIANGDVFEPPAAFGEPDAPNGRLHTAYVTDGQVSLPVPPGSHRIVVSRGFEYELYEETVEVTAGETAEIAVALDRVVDSTGIMCGDFHIHTHRSPDSGDDADDKLAAAIADGLEIPVRSEHEFVMDFEPLIAEMGISQWAYGVGSIELTTFAWGHFGVFPLAPDTTRPNNGAFAWAGRMPPAVFADVRGVATDPAFIINHPRSGGGGFGNFQAYFDAAGYDPATGTADPEMWDDQFSLVEVFNNSDFEAERDRGVLDWFSFLQNGRRVFAIGSSDSHYIYRSPVGYPRTCMNLGVDTPEDIRTMGSGHIRDTLRAGQSVISGGILIDAYEVTTEAGPGGDADGVGETATIRVTVQAPSWVPVSELEVIVDGGTVMTAPIDASTEDPTNPAIRFQTDIEVPVAAENGSWVVFHAKGEGGLAPVHPGKGAFGVTNPIFLTR